MNFDQSIPYPDRDSYGFVNREERGWFMPHYYPREVFKHHPTLPLIVGNFGTIINELYFGYKMIPYYDLDDKNWFISYSYNDAMGNRIGVIKKVCHLIVETFVEGYNTKDYRVIHENGDKNQNVYAPGAPWHNLKVVTTREFMAWRFRNDLRREGQKGVIGSDLSDETVHAICRLLSEGKKNQEILDTLNIESGKSINQFIYELKSGYKRTDISSQYTFPASKNHKYTEEEYEYICQLLAQGNSVSQVMQICRQTRNLPVTKDVCRSIKNGKMKKIAPMLQKYGFLKEEQ